MKVVDVDVVGVVVLVVVCEVVAVDVGVVESHLKYPLGQT